MTPEGIAAEQAHEEILDEAVQTQNNKDNAAAEEAGVNEEATDATEAEASDMTMDDTTGSVDVDIAAIEMSRIVSKGETAEELPIYWW